MRFEYFRYPFYVIMHPFKGFWDLKFENKGKIQIAIGILLLLALTFIIKKQFAGFVVNYNDLRKLNSIDELKYVVLPFILWCVANWSLTTLMDGEGKFKEIVMVTGYALLPMIIIYLPQTFFSNFMKVEESAFYYFFDTLAYLWFLWLLFIGIMTVHQYTVTKTIVTFLLTLVVIGVIIFIGLLFFSLIQQILSFLITIYEEVTFRM